MWWICELSKLVSFDRFTLTYSAFEIEDMTRFFKKTRNLTDYHIWYQNWLSKTWFVKLSEVGTRTRRLLVLSHNRQKFGIGDTKPVDIILQWLKRYNLGPMDYPFSFDKDIKSLNGINLDCHIGEVHNQHSFISFVFDICGFWCCWVSQYGTESYEQECKDCVFSWIYVLENSICNQTRCCDLVCCSFNSHVWNLIFY